MTNDLIDTPEHREKVAICRELAVTHPFSDTEFYEYGERIVSIARFAGIPYSAALYRDALSLAANMSVELGTGRLGV